MALTLPADSDLEPDCPPPAAVLKIVKESLERFQKAFPIIAMNSQWSSDFESEIQRVARDSYEAGRQAKS